MIQGPSKNSSSSYSHFQTHVSDLLSCISLHSFHSTMVFCDACSENILLHCSMILNSHGHPHILPRFNQYFVSQLSCFLSKCLGNKCLYTKNLRPVKGKSLYFITTYNLLKSKKKTNSRKCQ